MTRKSPRLPAYPRRDGLPGLRCGAAGATAGTSTAPNTATGRTLPRDTSPYTETGYVLTKPATIEPKPRDTVTAVTTEQHRCALHLTPGQTERI